MPYDRRCHRRDAFCSRARSRRILTLPDSRTSGKYSVELPGKSGEVGGIEKILARHDDLAVARLIYKMQVSLYSDRLVPLCDRARVLARSDCPQTMPK